MRAKNRERELYSILCGKLIEREGFFSCLLTHHQRAIPYLSVTGSLKLEKRLEFSLKLVLRAFWERNATVALHEPDALPLVVHSPYSCPPDKLSSVMIQPGMTYTIAVSQEKVERLPAPYKSNCIDYISRGNQKKYFGYYTQDICVQNCEMSLEMKHCQCVRTHHEFAATFGGQVCDIIRDGYWFHQLLVPVAAGNVLINQYYWNQ
ncbi:hypothetical protein V5799_020957 [Amblyomma americanum]|uniref:Amiloride-sensitive sodium channel n=1 Tax=Amblyomma americanum TaxID=6943 RepID=A0AAQ4ESL3_AMBAM